MCTTGAPGSERLSRLYLASRSKVVRVTSRSVEGEGGSEGWGRFEAYRLLGCVDTQPEGSVKTLFGHVHNKGVV